MASQENYSSNIDAIPVLHILYIQVSVMLVCPYEGGGE